MKKGFAIYIFAALLVLSISFADYNPPLFSTPSSVKGLIKLGSSFANTIDLSKTSSKSIKVPTTIFYNGLSSVKGTYYYRVDFIFDSYQYKYLIPYLKLDVYSNIKKTGNFYYGKRIYSNFVKVQRVNSSKYVTIIRFNNEKIIINNKSYKSNLPIFFKFYLTKSVADRFTTISSLYKIETPRKNTKVKVNFTSSPSGAVVYLGSKMLGITPFYTYLYPGDYLVRFFKKGYSQHNVKFMASGDTVNVSTTFASRMPIISNGKVILSVNPPDATIMFNGKLSPQSEFVLPAGTYTVAISADGYESQSFTFTVEANKTKTYYVTLKKKISTLILNVKPSDSKIYVDGKYFNGNVFELSSGIHEIKITNNGYKDAYFSVNLNAGKTTTLNIELQPLNGYLTITSNVKSKVYVNGQYIGYTNISNYSLLPGNYSVELVNSTFDFKVQVDVEAGKTKTLNLSFNIN